MIPCLLAGLTASEWVDLGDVRPSQPIWDVNSISESNIEITFGLGGYNQELLDNGKTRVSFPGGVPILERGAPEMSRMARSIIIPDLANMELSVTSSDFIDIPLDDVEPSKGNLTRDVDPSTVPYTYGKSYETNAFYPKDIVFLILSDYIFLH